MHGPGILLSTLDVLIHLIFLMILLGGHYYHPHFAEEEPEEQRS